MGAHLERARILIDQARYALAKDELYEQLSQTPDDATAHALLGVCYVYLQDLKKATDEANAAVRLAPGDPFPYAALTFVCRRRGLVDQAEKAIQEAIRLDPHEPAYFDELASIYLDEPTSTFDTSPHRKALEAARQGVRIAPLHAGCLNSLAMAHYQLGQFAEARKALDTARSVAPEDPRTIRNCGLLLTRFDNFDAATETLREALRIQPTSVETHAQYQTTLTAWFFWTAFRLMMATTVSYLVLCTALRTLDIEIPRIVFIPVVVGFVVGCNWLVGCLTPFHACLTYRWFRQYRPALTAGQVLASNCILMFTAAAACTLVIDFLPCTPSMGCAATLVLCPLGFAVAASLTCPGRQLKAALTVIVVGLIVLSVQLVFVETTSTLESWQFKVLIAGAFICAWLPKVIHIFYEKRSFWDPYPE
jgi:Flp pilus assembly protein TadD